MPMLRLACAAAVLLCALPTPCHAQQLGRKATEVVVQHYRDADNWATKALILLSMGSEFDPVPVAPAMVEAFESKDKRMHAFALEVLKRADDKRALSLATGDLLVVLIAEHAKSRNKEFAKAVLEVLPRMVPDAGAKTQKEWKRWWSKNRREWAAPEWVPPPAKSTKAVKGGGNTVSTMLVERALDLNAAGLDLAITIDSTGSMQAPINAARDAVLDLVEILQSIAPEFRLGLTHYKDHGDMKDGADMLEPLTKNVKKVRERLAKLIASGGGDAPERVEKGLEFALGRAMGWNPKANKVVIIIGDAPAHYDGLVKAKALAKQAHEDPANLGRGNRPTTGKKSAVRPYVISTIGTNQMAMSDFKEIAAAGGGTATLLQMRKKSSRAVVKNILQMSFGAKFRTHVADMVEVYFDWRDKGLFKR